MARRSKTKQANAVQIQAITPGAEFTEPRSNAQGNTKAPMKSPNNAASPIIDAKLNSPLATGLDGFAKLSVNDTEATPQSTEASKRGVLFFDDASNPSSGFLCPTHESCFSVRGDCIEEFIVPHRHESEVGGLPGRHKGNKFISIEHGLIFARAVMYNTGTEQSIATSQSRKTILTNAEWEKDELIFDARDSRAMIADLLKFAIYAKFGDGETGIVRQEGARMVCKLLDTGNKELVYANGQDRVLGIGFAVGATTNDAKRGLQCRHQWGENLLGKFLEELREKLRPKEAEWREIKKSKW